MYIWYFILFHDIKLIEIPKPQIQCNGMNQYQFSRHEVSYFIQIYHDIVFGEYYYP